MPLLIGSKLAGLLTITWPVSYVCMYCAYARNTGIDNLLVIYRPKPMEMVSPVPVAQQVMMIMMMSLFSSALCFSVCLRMYQNAPQKHLKLPKFPRGACPLTSLEWKDCRVPTLSTSANDIATPPHRSMALDVCVHLKYCSYVVPNLYLQITLIYLWVIGIPLTSITRWAWKCDHRMHGSEINYLQPCILWSHFHTLITLHGKVPDVIGFGLQ